MKKIVLLPLSIFFIGGLSAMPKVFPSDNNPDKSVNLLLQTDKKVKIKINDLPKAVKDSLDDKESGWELTNAYRMTSRTDNTEYYQVELKKDMQTKTINLSSEGRKLSKEVGETESEF